MSILSALKTKGAKGNNIEEAVKTLPIGGESSNEAFFVTITMDGQGGFHSDKTYAEIKQAYNSKVPMYVRADIPTVYGTAEHTVPCVEHVCYNTDGDGKDKIRFQRLDMPSMEDHSSMIVATAIIGIDYVAGEPQEETVDVDFSSVTIGE